MIDYLWTCDCGATNGDEDDHCHECGHEHGLLEYAAADFDTVLDDDYSDDLIVNLSILEEENERLTEKVACLERENESLRDELIEVKGG